MVVWNWTIRLLKIKHGSCSCPPQGRSCIIQLYPNLMAGFQPQLWISGWWFGTFFIFPYIGNNHPNWLIFFRGVAQPPTRYYCSNQIRCFSPTGDEVRMSFLLSSSIQSPLWLFAYPKSQIVSIGNSIPLTVTISYIANTLVIETAAHFRDLGQAIATVVTQFLDFLGLSF